MAIVGGGPAGLAVTSALWHLGIGDVVVLDDADRPCGRFFDRIDTLRQRVLRSPYEHHPGVEGYRDCELLDFARLHWRHLTPTERREIRMAQSGQRSVVPVDVFEAYVAHVAQLHGAGSRMRRTTVTGVHPDDTGADVHTADGALRADCVVLCLGEQTAAAPSSWWPAPGLPPGVQYWDTPVPDGAGPVAVVGAGLSAAHVVANALADGRAVTWVVRAESERYQCADVDAAFFRPEGRARFDGVGWPERAELLRRHRRASVMLEFRPLLRAAEADGRLTVLRDADVQGITAHRSTPTLITGRGQVTAERIVLALGTTPSSGAGLLPPDVVAARDGWPDLDPRTLAYRASGRVFAAGAAAGMVLGPAARNIDGHRVATARIATTVAATIGGFGATTEVKAHAGTR